MFNDQAIYAIDRGGSDSNCNEYAFLNFCEIEAMGYFPSKFIDNHRVNNEVAMF